MNENLTIIDLISEKHIVLRREVENRWADSEEEDISHTEALLLAKISMGKISLAEIARQANISRQAMFKCAKKLEERGYLVFVTNEHGNKYTELTLKGNDYCKRSQELKEELENKIADVLGKEQVKMLKELLNKNWI
ncbi:transcriptional regulator, RpiR family [Clostridium cavendishii DSM 21758]|uniref:Transcriptional regulator, RpiR family n=1 Tax=Clostridium cavendishii DSM 21758 TaxID=1121302 RepID=A0A1M6GNA9_9CLOT|nr:MarR family transcriptional regulator [Clostridium cavendishii]SHJ11411.1 transcriptional regulator, RpiR family [Clostridium cavendishii DSM 21758]